MTDTTYDVMKPEKGVPIKTWTKGVPLEDAARQQLLNVAQLPFIYRARSTSRTTSAQCTGRRTTPWPTAN